MEIVTRSEARKLGLTQYFTGAPCKNGHTAIRYTQSGTCSACIRSYSISTAPEVIRSIKERREKLASLIQFKVRLFTGDLPLFSAMVHAAALAHDPTLNMHEVRRGEEGTDKQGGTAMYSFSCFAEDLEQLRASAVKLFAEQTAKAVANVDETRTRFLKAIGTEE